MFSIYGPTGRVFQGTLEQMRQIRRVTATDRSRAIDPLLHDGRDSALREAVDSGFLEPSRASVALTQSTAIATYTALQQPARQAWHELPASHVMQTPVLTVLADSRVDAAWRQLLLQGRGQAPVVSADNVLVGLVTRAEFVQQGAWTASPDAMEAWDTWQSQPVESVMLTPIPSVAANADMRRVASALLDSGLPGLPVVNDDGHVIGFVSRTDVLRVALDDAGLDVWG